MPATSVVQTTTISKDVPTTRVATTLRTPRSSGTQVFDSSQISDTMTSILDKYFSGKEGRQTLSAPVETPEKTSSQSNKSQPQVQQVEKAPQTGTAHQAGKEVRSESQPSSSSCTTATSTSKSVGRSIKLVRIARSQAQHLELNPNSIKLVRLVDRSASSAAAQNGDVVEACVITNQPTTSQGFLDIINKYTLVYIKMLN